MITDKQVRDALTAFNKAVNEPIMLKCERCDGRGYRHGFGENGHDPDWCEVCGGGQYVVAPGEEGRAMRLALEAAAISTITSAGADAPILRGIGRHSGDGWKDTTKKGDIVFVWNRELPPPYAAGQYPRIGKEHWSASTDQYNFTYASLEEIEALFSTYTHPPASEAQVRLNGSVGDAVMSYLDKLHKEAEAEYRADGGSVNAVRAGMARQIKNEVGKVVEALSTPEQGETAPSPETHLEASFAEAMKILNGLAIAYGSLPTSITGHGSWHSHAVAFLDRHRAAVASEGQAE